MTTITVRHLFNVDDETGSRIRELTAKIQDLAFTNRVTSYNAQLRKVSAATVIRMLLDHWDVKVPTDEWVTNSLRNLHTNDSARRRRLLKEARAEQEFRKQHATRGELTKPSLSQVRLRKDSFGSEGEMAAQFPIAPPPNGDARVVEILEDFAERNQRLLGGPDAI